jgi:hypothetical protein
MKKIINKIFRMVDRTVAGSIGKQILFFLVIVIGMFGVLFIVSVLLFPLHSQEQSVNNLFWTIVYNLIEPGGFDDLNNLESLLILITNVSGMVLFAGVLVALLTNTIFQRIDKIKNGQIYYAWNDHIVIIGFNPICNALVAQFAAQNEVVLQTSRDVQSVWQELSPGLSDKLKKRVTVISGNRISREVVAKLNIDKCKQIFLLGETDEDNHDSQNIECLGIINEIVAEVGKNMRCHVLFDRQSTFVAFQQQELAGIRENIDFVPFNFYDMWAQKIFVKNTYNKKKINYKPLDREPITVDSDMRVHLVILGMSNMGIALGIQAAQLCHFPNFVTKGIKTRITFIDENADHNMNILKTQFRCFFDEIDYSFRSFGENIQYNNDEKKKFTDIEFEFIKAHFEDDAVQRYLEEAALQKTSFITVAIALPESSAALETALYLPTVVYDSGASVLVRQEHSCAIVSMLSQEEEGVEYRKYKNLRPFGMLSDSYDLEQVDDLLPMMVKYVYDNTTDEQTILDFPKDVIWHNWITNWRKTDNISALKASNRYAANFIFVKQRSLGIKEGMEMDSQQINLAAQVEHNRWVIEKLLVGFRAPTPEEAEGIAKENKRSYYKAHFIHEDIKAYQILGKDDKAISVKVYDVNISRALPYMLKGLQRNA